MKIWSVMLAVAMMLALPMAAFPEGDPDPVPSFPAEAAKRSPYDEGRSQINMGNWDRAVSLFRQAVAQKPDDYKALNMLGYTLRRTGKAKEALDAYNRALALKPDYAEALEYRGVAHLKMGNRKAAEADYQRLVKLGSPLAKDLREEIEKTPSN